MKNQTFRLPAFFNEGEPDFINEEGTKWWLQTLPSKHDDTLRPLGIRWYYIETANEEASHIILENNTVLHATQQIEGVGAYLDMLFVREQYSGGEKNEV